MFCSLRSVPPRRPVPQACVYQLACVRLMTITPRLMTTEELDAIPDDGKERWLIEGQLRVAGDDNARTFRSFRHSRTQAKLGSVLSTWNQSQPQPRGEVLSSAGFPLAVDPDTNAGVDLAYISADTARANPDDQPVDGAPVLAIEIL